MGRVGIASRRRVNPSPSANLFTRSRALEANLFLIIVVSIAALFTSGLTFFSGFGLGTLLLPFFLIVFPPPVAVAATAAVHLVNNLFENVYIPLSSLI